MGLDIRLPIGVLFSVFGLLLTVFGALSSRALYERSLGVNVNLVWGIVLLAFGISMLVLGRRRSAPRQAGSHEMDETADLPPKPVRKQDAVHN